MSKCLDISVERYSKIRLVVFEKYP